MNMNEFARKVALLEGKKRQVNIAQIKEILRIVLIELAKRPDDEILKIVKRYEGAKI